MDKHEAHIAWKLKTSNDEADAGSGMASGEEPTALAGASGKAAAAGGIMACFLCSAAGVCKGVPASIPTPASGTELSMRRTGLATSDANDVAAASASYTCVSTLEGSTPSYMQSERQFRGQTQTREDSGVS